MSEPRASILICTRNRSELLRECLETIIADRSTVAREIVVVDNGSTDDTDAVIRAFAAGSPHPVRYVLEPRLGTSHARNAAVAAARGDLILFADDDVLVDDGWADALVVSFDDPEVAVVAGRILPKWPYEPPAWLDGPHMEILNPLDNGSEERRLGPGEYGTGANLALRGELVRALDPPFNPRLGHANGLWIGHEEEELIDRLRPLGSLLYRPDALVHHRIAAERIDLAWLRTSFFRQGVAKGRRHRIDGEPVPSLARRAVRAARAVREVVVARGVNDAGGPSASATWRELLAVALAGFQLELLVGRSKRVSDWLVRRGV